jgi:hypothetical protein
MRDLLDRAVALQAERITGEGAAAEVRMLRMTVTADEIESVHCGTRWRWGFRVPRNAPTSTS